jgi:hypothetical protein
MRRKINVNELYVLEKKLNCRGYEKKIRDYFKKRTYKSETSQYKEGSENWKKSVEADQEIEKIPDYQVKDTYKDIEIYSDNTHDKVKFSILEIPIQVRDFEYDDYGESYSVFKETTGIFLCDNSYWGHEIITSLSDLIENYNIKELIKKEQAAYKDRKWRKIFSDEYSSYILLIGDVIKADEDLKEIKVYDNKLEIDGKNYTKEYLDKLYDLYRNESYEFYDKNDKKIKYEYYRYNSFVEFYEMYNKEEKSE